METIRKCRKFLFHLFLSFLALASVSCGSLAQLFLAPTATLSAKVDSPLQSRLIGQWKLSGSSPWGEATLTFSDDGGLSMVGGLQEMESQGSYFFTSEDTIAYILPAEQGSMALEFLDDNNIDLIITRSSDVFGLMASAEKVK